MPGERTTGDTMTVRGQGTVARDAIQSLLAALATAIAEAAIDEADQVAVVRASATSLEELIPALVRAALAAGDDLDLTLADASLDGLIATDDGWRAWGTISGCARCHEPVHRWRPGEASVEQAADGRVIVSLALQEDAACA